MVVDHDTKRVVWAGEGRSAETLAAFFERLGEERCAAIQEVTIDMAGGYQKAVREALPDATVIFDRFHVQRLAADALDAVRRDQVRDLGGMGKGIKGLRYVLLKHPEKLKPAEHQRLADLRRGNRPLLRAYQLKEYLAEIYELTDLESAAWLLEDWAKWAQRSRLWPFVKLARTLRKHRTGILAYIESRLTNGIVEGINNKLRVIARRAYGFHSPQALTAMLFLTCGGIQLQPALPGPTREVDPILWTGIGPS